MKVTKQSLEYWLSVRNKIKNSTPVDTNMSIADKKLFLADLESDPQRWKEYFFPKHFKKYRSPEFHIRATKRLLKNFFGKKHYYEVKHWVRGLSKTTLTMMDVLYLVLTGHLRNIIYTSSTYDAAELFLERYRSQLDSNERIKFFYGEQELPGNWSMGSFTTRNGVKFLALGAGQSPRGNGNEEIRPDCIIVDDFDTDEECRNPDIINKKWDWFEKALFFTVDTSEPYLILWLGNIIAEDCCVVRAGKIADHTEVINIRDANGKSVWPEKNSEEDIDYQLSKVSYESGQQELYNNPLRQGQTFKEITWGKCPQRKHMRFLLQYGDPATSNKDKPTLRSKAYNSMKGTGLLGYKDGKFYLYTCFLDNMSNSHFVDSLYAVRDYVQLQSAFYTFIENNTLQDPFYEQVLLPLVRSRARERKCTTLSVTPDATKKPEKWFRIEADLEPLVREGLLVFNIDEKDNPHMQRMAAQFLTATPNSKELGGPDLVQGGVHIIKSKLAMFTGQKQLEKVDLEYSDKKY